MSGRLSGKVALVTGGSSGLGAGIVQRFLEEGATVWNADLNAPAEAAGRYVSLDVRDEAQWEQVLAAIVAESGGLHILVNNAGIFTSAPVDETPVEDFRRVLDVNVIGVFLGCKHGVRTMKAGGGGSIINLSSVTGLRGQVGGAAYGASKAAVKMLSKTVALEGAAHAIRCNSIHPGIIESPMLRSAMDSSGNPDAVERHIKGYLPLGFIGDPVLDIGNMALYLASDESRYITATEMVVDGGMISGLPS